MEIAALTGYALFATTMVCIYAIMALGLNIQWGMTGQINIGVAGFYALGAYTSAILTAPPTAQHLGGFDLPFLVGMAGAVVVSGFAALLIGLVTVRLRADYLAIATIGFAEIIRLVLANESWLTHGVRGIAEIPRPLVDSGPTAAPVFLAITVACLAIVYLLIERARVSPWGRVLRAIRDDEDATLAAGKNVTRFRLEAFVVGSCVMGLAGGLYAHFVGFISPEAFLPVFGTFIIWVMLIVGGSGNNAGAVIGAALIWLLWAGTEMIAMTLPAEHAAKAGAARVLLVGVLLQVALLARPQGLLPEPRPRGGRQARQ